jgi:hypothetical protein
VITGRIERAPIPAKPGRRARHEYEYERNGVAHDSVVGAGAEFAGECELTVALVHGHDPPGARNPSCREPRI